jgi:hypothetical protein
VYEQNESPVSVPETHYSKNESPGSVPETHYSKNPANSEKNSSAQGNGLQSNVILPFD